MRTPPNYSIDIPAIANAVADCARDMDHQHRRLVETLQQFEPLAGVKITWIRGIWWFPDARVLDASGATVLGEEHKVCWTSRAPGKYAFCPGFDE